jgi:hypothetical protein
MIKKIELKKDEIYKINRKSMVLINVWNFSLFYERQDTEEPNY